jgi:imidazolonepropionase-like amidohydrolase
MPRNWKLLGAVALLASACAPTSLPPSNESAPIVIVGAKLIDGTPAAPIDDSVIVIEGRRIKSAGPRSHTPVPKGGEIIDGIGKTVIPGLVDTHVHYFGDRAAVERAFRAQLYFGVTTTRSIGVDSDETLAIVEEARLGKIPAPRLYTAGRGFSHPVGHPVGLAIRRPATAEAAREDVRQLAAQEIDFTKMWVESKHNTVPKITPEIRQAIVDEAGKNDIRVVAHISDEADLLQLANLGVTDFLHTVRDKELASDALVQIAKEKGLTFSPTLCSADSSFYLAEHPEVVNDPEFRAALPPEVLAELDNPETPKSMLTNPEIPLLKTEFQRALAFIKRMHDAGVRLAVGSDGGAGRIAPGWGTHHEMEQMATSGIAPIDVIRAATGNGTALLERGEPEYGTIEAGKLADLILLSADPSADITNTRKIERVMQSGNWIDRSGLLN